MSVCVCKAEKYTDPINSLFDTCRLASSTTNRKSNHQSFCSYITWISAMITYTDNHYVNIYQKSTLIIPL